MATKILLKSFHITKLHLMKPNYQFCSMSQGMLPKKSLYDYGGCKQLFVGESGELLQVDIDNFIAVPSGG